MPTRQVRAGWDSKVVDSLCRPREAEACCGMLDGVDKTIDRAGASVEVSGREEQHGGRLGLGDYHRCGAVRRGPDRSGLIVSVKCDDRHGESGSTSLPIRSLAHRTVCDVAKRAMPPSEPNADPVAEFTAQRAVRVVHANESDDEMGWWRTRRCHLTTITHRRPIPVLLVMHEAEKGLRSRVRLARRCPRHIRQGACVALHSTAHRIPSGGWH